MSKPLLVHEDSKSIHLGMAIVLIYHAELSSKNLVGISLKYDDIIKLGEILTPKRNYWHTEYHQAVREIFIPELKRQHPLLSKIDVSEVTQENFKRWLNKQAKKFGSKYLKLKKIKYSKV